MFPPEFRKQVEKDLARVDINSEDPMEMLKTLRQLMQDGIQRIDKATMKGGGR